MGNVISLIDRLKNEQFTKEVTKDRPTALIVSHKSGKVFGQESGTDFATRLSNIRESINKINRLMNELKELKNDRSST